MLKEQGGTRTEKSYPKKDAKLGIVKKKKVVIMKTMMN